MPAPIITKIPRLQNRVTGLTSGNSNPSGVETFLSTTHQNIFQHLQEGLGGAQIGSNFVIGGGNVYSQNIRSLFDDDTTTAVNIKHNDKENWIVFDLGKNREINRMTITPSGINPGGGTPNSQLLSLKWFFWTKDQNPLNDQATLESDFGTPTINHSINTTTTYITNNTSKFQYIGLRIDGFPNGYNEVNMGTDGGNIGFLNFENLEIYETFDTRDYIVEFNDSVLDMHSWTGLRYKGCKTTGKKINKFTSYSDGGSGIGQLQIGNNFVIDQYFPLPIWVGDKTYGKAANVENKTTALYITNTIIGGKEEDQYARIKHHSYIKIDKILIINLNDDTVKILDSQTEDFTSFHRYVTTDFPTTSKFSLRLLDDYIQSNLKTEYRVKMNKGWLLKSFEYNAEGGPLPGMDKDKTTELNTTSQAAGNVLNTVVNPLSLYDAVSGSIQRPNRIFGFNKQLNPDSGVGLYGCEDNNEVCTGKDSASMASEISDFYSVFSYGPYYFSGSTYPNPNNVNIALDGTKQFISTNTYNQHAGGDFRFRFGVTGNIDDLATSTGTPDQSFYPLYVGDNTSFIDNKFTREFIKQENNSQQGVKNFNFANIEEIEQTSGVQFSNWISDSKINPSVTASLFIGQCVQYLNSHSLDTELHLTLFDGTKDFSGNNDEMSIGTFEVDRNVNPGYLDFADNLGKLYNSVGPRAKYLKLKNSPQFRPSIQPAKYDRFIYDTIETSTFQALISERQNSFVFGPGTLNSNLNSTLHVHDETLGTNIEQPISTYDNSSINSDNFSGSFQYQLSFLDKDSTLITNLDKTAELFDGVGGLGAVVIPEHLHEAVKINLYYYLQKAGIIERTTVKKVVKPI